jgi:3-phosphoshikimate 1-carboxyvinyltransferase
MRLIKPYAFQGQLIAPSSKSYLQRVLAIASIADSASEIRKVSWSMDSKTALKLSIKLGCSTRQSDETLWITPGKPGPGGLVFDCKESGLALHLFSCIAATLERPVKVTGSGTLLNRPIDTLIRILQSNGVKVESINGKLPMTVTGPLSGGELAVDGSFSSQIVSGLLIALPLLPQDSILEISNPTSIPYIDMTIDIIEQFGVHISHDEFKTFYIQGNQHYEGIVYEVEGDWSAAANFLVAAAVSGEIAINGLNRKSRQGDRIILETLEKCGSQIKWEDGLLNIKKDKLIPFQTDATHCPDLFPPLVILAAACKGSSIIKGTQRLLFKESNRLNALKNLLKALGGSYTSAGNEFIVHGTGSLKGGIVDCHDDHRIAMAAAIAGAISTGNIEINEPEAVQKSYPAFFNDLKSCINKPTTYNL